MTTFVDHQHPRAGDGRFTAKDHPEADLELSTPAITLSEATGDWGPRFHDIDFRLAYEYTPSERAAEAFRAQFGAAPDAEVDGEYCFETGRLLVLKIRATGRVAVNFPGPTQFVAEANMLSAMARLAGNDKILSTDDYEDFKREHFLRASRAAEAPEEGYRHELSHIHRCRAGDPDRHVPSPHRLMGFTEPLPPLPSPPMDDWEIDVANGWPDSHPVSALLWRIAGTDLTVTAYAWTGHMPAHAKSLVPQHLLGPMVPISTMRVPHHQVQNIDELDVPVEEKALLAFLAATWIMMMTPTPAERKTSGPKTGGAPRPGFDDSAPLGTTIELRPLRHEDMYASDEKTGRVYKHRFVVRGFWRDQAYGPGDSQRRLT